MTAPYEPEHAAPADRHGDGEDGSGYGVSGRPLSAPAGEPQPNRLSWTGAPIQNVDGSWSPVPPPSDIGIGQFSAGYDGPNNVPWPNTLPPATPPPVPNPGISERGGDGGGGWSARRKVWTAAALVAAMALLAVVSAIIGTWTPVR